MRILVTGGCGFIGSHFIEEILKRDDVEQVVNIDSMTYAANKNLPFELDSRYKHFSVDITKDFVLFILKTFHVNYVVHFAAESHVDNSIKNSAPFIQTNVVGTHNLLECVRSIDHFKKFIHVSTDEVFGSLGPNDPPFTVNSPYRPNSPYAASKAASDLLVRSYNVTHKLPTVITNCSNNFGPRQYKEKMIPTCIDHFMKRLPVPVYGDGKNVRDWIYVKDHVNALINILEKGEIGEQYLIGGDRELSNLLLVYIIKQSYEEVTGQTVDYDFIKFVGDRKGHDFRYAINTEDYTNKLGKIQYNNFTDAIKETIVSYTT